MKAKTPPVRGRRAERGLRVTPARNRRVTSRLVAAELDRNIPCGPAALHGVERARAREVTVVKERLTPAGASYPGGGRLRSTGERAVGVA